MASTPSPSLSDRLFATFRELEQAAMSAGASAPPAAPAAAASSGSRIAAAPADLATDAAIAQLRLALAVRGRTDPATLLPATLPKAARLRALDVVSRECDTEGADGRWLLRDDVRKQVLDTSPRDVIDDALSNAPAEDSVARAIRTTLDAKAADLESLSAADVRALLAVVPSVTAKATGTPRPETLQWHLRRKQRVEAYERVVAARVYGRDDEMRELVDFCTAPSMATARVAARFLWGTGGVGKSTLLAAALRQVVDRAGPGAPVVAHLDFDRSDLDYTSPLALSIEVLSQAGLADEAQDARLQGICDDLRRQKRHSQRVKMASQESAYREASSLLYGALGWLQAQQRPLVLVLDTFEQVESGGATAFEALKTWLHQLLEVTGVATMRIVIAGRSDPAYTGAATSLPFDTEPDVFEVEELKEPYAVKFLEDGGVSGATAASLYRTLGGNPLVLRLVRELATQKGGTETLEGVVEEVRQKGALKELVQGVLYDRFLKHIQDDRAREIAHPGLVLPEITAELIQEVLAPLVGMTPMDGASATATFEALAAASWLVRREGTALVQRSDVRRLMLRLMTADPTRADDVRRVRRAAIMYHHGRTEAVHRASLAYHLLMDVATREDLRLLDRMDLSGCGPFLRRRRDELPEIAQTFVTVLDFEARPTEKATRRRIAPDITIPLEQAAAHLPDDLWQAWLAGEDGIGGGEGDRLAESSDPGAALRAWKARPFGAKGRPANFVLQTLAETGEWDDGAADLDSIVVELRSTRTQLRTPVLLNRLRWLTAFALMARPEDFAAQPPSPAAAGLAQLLVEALRATDAIRSIDTLPPLAALVEALGAGRETIVPDTFLKPEPVNDTTGRLALVKALNGVSQGAKQGSRLVTRVHTLVTLQRDFAQRAKGLPVVYELSNDPKSTAPAGTKVGFTRAQEQILALDGKPIAEVTRLTQSLARLVSVSTVNGTPKARAGLVLLLRGQLQELHRPARQALVESFRGAGRDVLYEYARRCGEHMTIVPLDLQPDTFARRCADDPAGCFHTLVQFADRARVLESVLTDALAFGTPSAKLPRVLRTLGMWDRALTGGTSSDWWSGETPEERERRRKPAPPVPFTPTTRRTESVMTESATKPAAAGNAPAANAPAGAAPRAHMSPEVLQKWLEKQKVRDPRVYAEAVEKLAKQSGPVTEGAMSPESTGALTPESQAFALETIVRQGRPALLVQDGKITKVDPATDELSREMITRLIDAAPLLEPVVPLVGRIDVANFVQPIEFVGTGWLVDTNVVVTNRHVAELIAKNQGGQWTFKPGRFGDPLRVRLDYRHELGRPGAESVDVVRVIWIEEDPKQADIAFLEVKPRANAGANPTRIELATIDAKPGDHVAVVGYPARAPAHIIPDQAWMDRIYGGEYDVKRIAPGLMDDPSRGWNTHDCTTLGGNSGSVVIDMKSGKAVGLHFAGLYMIENYAVPASTIRGYLRQRPWQGNGRGGAVVRRPEEPASTSDGKGAPQVQQPAPAPAPAAAAAQLSVTIPLTITLSVGQMTTTGATPATSATATPDAKSAARALLDAERGDGVLAVREGFAIRAGRLTRERCLVVSAHPDRIAAVRERVPSTYAGLPVQVRAATIEEQLAGASLTAEAVSTIQYDDDNRTGAGFSFEWVKEPMKALLHVGPERSWSVLGDFLRGAKQELVSSMYEFHAAHIADAIQERLPHVGGFMLVVARQTRDPDGAIPKGDFDRSETFDAWEGQFGDKFQRVFVPQGANGLVASSYHIKVTVRDGDSVWLSSGNWKRTSQPLLEGDALNDPRRATQAGNREWHAVIENGTLAQRFRNHIRADFDRSLALGGTPEAVGEVLMVDVPITALEAVEFEAPAARVLEPLLVDRTVRVKPLLTPDKRGAVYSKAVLSLIRSARRSLLFQIPYINIKAETTGFLDELAEALVERSQAIEDFRLLLSSTGSGFWDNVEELQRRGLDLGLVRRMTKTHTKGMVVDGARVLVGSHNWSSDGVTLNRDASLIFDDREIAEYYAQAFELDWDRATELQFDESVLTEAPRIATGDAPPKGFVRMTLEEFLER